MLNDGCGYLQGEGQGTRGPRGGGQTSTARAMLRLRGPLACDERITSRTAVHCSTQDSTAQHSTAPHSHDVRDGLPRGSGSRWAHGQPDGIRASAGRQGGQQGGGGGSCWGRVNDRNRRLRALAELKPLQVRRDEQTGTKLGEGKRVAPASRACNLRLHRAPASCACILRLARPMGWATCRLPDACLVVRVPEAETEGKRPYSRDSMG